MPSPALTMVPMNARSLESVSAASPFTACADFSDADDSPDRMLSLHSRPLTSISRTSAGTDFTQRQPDHVAGHQDGHVDPAELLVATHHSRMVDARNAVQPRRVRRGTR